MVRCESIGRIDQQCARQTPDGCVCGKVCRGDVCAILESLSVDIGRVEPVDSLDHWLRYSLQGGKVRAIELSHGKKLFAHLK